MAERSNLLATRSQRLLTRAVALKRSCRGRCSNTSPKVASSRASAMPRVQMGQLDACICTLLGPL